MEQSKTILASPPARVEFADFFVECLECSQGRRRRACEGSWICFYCTEEYVHNLVVECGEDPDHDVFIQGAWTSPLIKFMLKKIGISKRKVMNQIAKKKKMLEDKKC